MPTAATPLQGLAQRIQQQESELANLYKELESRNATLAKLARQKEELQAQLQQIESEMEAVGEASTSAPSAGATPAAQKKPAASMGTIKHVPGVSLPKLLVSIIQDVERPISTKELV